MYTHIYEVIYYQICVESTKYLLTFVWNLCWQRVYKKIAAPLKPQNFLKQNMWQALYKRKIIVIPLANRKLDTENISWLWTFELYLKQTGKLNDCFPFLYTFKTLFYTITVKDISLIFNLSRRKLSVEAVLLLLEASELIELCLIPTLAVEPSAWNYENKLFLLNKQYKSIICKSWYYDEGSQGSTQRRSLCQRCNIFIIILKGY